MTLNGHFFSLNSVLHRYLLALKPGFQSLTNIKPVRNRRTLNQKEQLRHRTVSLRQHSFLVLCHSKLFLRHLCTNFLEALPHDVGSSVIGQEWKPRNAAAVLFGLKFADNIDHKFKSSQASKARLQSSKHTGAKQKLTQNGHHVIIFTFEEISNSSTRIIRAQLYRSNCGKCDTLNVLSRRVV